MTATSKQKLAEVNGVIIPSKIQAGQKPLKAMRTRPPISGLDSKRTSTCPICGHAATKPNIIRTHFVTCVKRNGNPTGARWDDNITFERTNTASLLTKSLRPKEERDARKRHFYERLATVNGIITPSKLPPGETPIRAIYDTSEDRKYACPICGELHKKKYHVQSHFASCAERNGNPRGARWDDACRGTMSHAAVMNTGVSREPQHHEIEDAQPEGYQTPARSLYGPITAYPSLDGSQLSEPSSTASLANYLRSYNLGLNTLDPQLLAL